MYNHVGLQGRIPFDINEPKGDAKFLSFAISVQRNYKPEGEQYPQSDLIFVKAFGKTAENIHKFFKKGDHIIVSGRLQRDDDYEKDGETVRGQLSVICHGFDFCNSGSRESSSEGTTVSKSTTGGIKLNKISNDEFPTTAPKIKL